MKLIFIDIDGVLNSALGEGPYISDMEIDKLILLNRLIKESNSDGIVITSDRRTSEIDMKNKLETFNQYNIKVIGVTRNPNEEEDEDNRVKQIMDYLASSKEEIEKIVILDDMDDGISNYFDEEFILVNRLFGLNEDIYKKAMDCLQL